MGYRWNENKSFIQTPDCWMKTHFEIFDKMLEEVQQLRLDSNHFAKSTSRTDARIAKIRKKCKRYEEKLMRKPSERWMAKIMKYHSIVRKLLRSSNNDIETFKNVVHGLKEKCESLCSEAETPFNLEEPSISGINCIVNAGEGGDSNMLYCKCNQPPFRSMIACDSPDCKIGWFHCECVGVTSSIKIPWVCPECKMTTMLVKRGYNGCVSKY